MGTLEIRHQLSMQRFIPTWSILQRILFRFVFAYLVLYNLFGGNSLLQYLWDPVILWVGELIFQVNITIRPLGSGDTTWNYVQLFCFLAVAVIATGVWSLWDRKRANYERLHQWLRVFIRFGLGYTMIFYGAVKFIPLQMPAPHLDRLLQPFGDASPMGLLWTFMGASAGYQIFTGTAEMLGGLLLIGRRTTLLGALVCLGVMGNVVMLNFCYDVPVKLLSSHLLVMAVFLIVPDLRRLANLFVFGRRVEPALDRPLFAGKGFQRGVLVFRCLLAGLIGLSLWGLYAEYQAQADPASQPTLYGIWNVEEFEVDGEIQPLLVTDAFGWRRLVFDFPGTVSIHRLNDAHQRYGLKVDAAAKTLTVTKFDDPAWQAILSFKETEPGLLTVEGTFDGKKLRVKLRRMDESQFLLLSREFHWINEVPYNK